MDLLNLKLALAPPTWRILRATLKTPPLAEGIPLTTGPLIFACLHRDIIGAILYVAPARPTLLVSGSDDGLILVRTLGEKNYNFVRGATGENGGRALVHLRRSLNDGQHIGLAVDGPKGPFGEIHPGVFQLAKLTGSTIVPLRPLVSPALVLDSWDRTVVPLPFSKIRVQVGPMHKVSAEAGDEEFKALREQLDEFFQSGAGG